MSEQHDAPAGAVPHLMIGGYPCRDRREREALFDVVLTYGDRTGDMIHANHEWFHGRMKLEAVRQIERQAGPKFIDLRRPEWVEEQAVRRRVLHGAGQ